MTISDGTHNETVYYVASNANAADGTFNTRGDLVSALNNTNSATHSTITASSTAGGLTLASSGKRYGTGRNRWALGFGTLDRDRQLQFGPGQHHLRQHADNPGWFGTRIR